MIKLPISYGEILKQFFFSKKKRLVSNRQFEAVLSSNVRVTDGLLVLYVAENDCGYARLGVSISKSCGNAIERNRLKRLLREAFRQNQNHLSPGFDYLLMISPQLSKKLNKSIKSKDAMRQLRLKPIKESFLALSAAAVKIIG